MTRINLSPGQRVRRRAGERAQMRRPLRNGSHGYGLVTRTLHWLTVVLLAMQVVVGYTMGEAADRADARVDAFEERGEKAAEERGDAADERFEREVERREKTPEAREDTPSNLHVGLGLVLLGLGVARMLWRHTTPLPPWSDRLSPRDRRVQAGLERALLGLLFIVPATGLLLLVAGDWVALHIATHIALYVVITAHVGLVLLRRTARRMVTGSDRSA